MANKNTEDMKNYHHKIRSCEGRWQRTLWNTSCTSATADRKVSCKLEDAYKNDGEMGYNVECKITLFKF